jgi:TfoX/Sxy family transcriptional regulator of competence genes
VAYDERLAARVRALLAGRSDVSERKMFGGLTFMVGGNMCCGVNGEELIVRLDPGHEGEALARPHARPMDLTRRRMRGFITVHRDGLAASHLDRWVHEAVARAETLPPK